MRIVLSVKMALLAAYSALLQITFDIMKRCMLIVLFLISLGISLFSQVDYKSVDHFIDSLVELGEKYELTEILDEIDKNFNSEKNKVRAVFSWISNTINYDNHFEEIESGVDELSKLNRINNILKNRKGTCLDYSYLFDFMCSYLSIHSGVVDGIVKLKKTESIEQIKLNRHVWNYVAIEGEEFFIDVTLGELYYLIPPSKLIFSHFPDDSEWQLLSSPVKLEEYFSMPFVNPNTFLKEKEILDIYPKSNINKGLNSKMQFKIELHPNENSKYTFGIRKGDKFRIKQKTTTTHHKGLLVIDYTFVPDNKTEEIQIMIKKGLGGYRELASYRIDK